jgi:hypothetical protein
VRGDTVKKPFSELNLGYSNAENYRRRENKELLAKYFVQDHYLDRVLDPSVYFLIGEKGTGKTAYATFLQNNDYRNHKAWIYDVRQTEYQKFLELKKKEHLVLSQYGDVWHVLLLMSIASSILYRSGTPDFLKRFTKLNGLKKAIDEFYDNAFAPELVKMLSFVESGEVSASLVAKYGGSGADVGAKKLVEIHDSKSLFQINLLKIRKAFETAIAALKLDSNYIIFIDGIDVRPGDIAYADYFDCVRGLIEAIWAINNDFLANVKDSAGRIRVVLLVRPDIFLKTGLHNVNTKIRDNSVFLNWITTYKDYRTSLLFRVADRLLAVQQDTPSKVLVRPGITIFRFTQRMSGKITNHRKVASIHFWPF